MTKVYLENMKWIQPIDSERQSLQCVNMLRVKMELMFSEWLYENGQAYNLDVKVIPLATDKSILIFIPFVSFENTIDAVAFKLRWI